MDLHKPVDPNKTYEQMTSEERLRWNHQKLHEAHVGHESAHATMVLILLGTLATAQLIVVTWRARAPRSYARFTAIAMWALPPAIAVRNRWYRFLVVWALCTLLTALVIRRALARPLPATAPRMLYKWFYLVYKLSCGLGVIGYILMMLTFLGINTIFNSPPAQWMDVSLTLLFYGLYLGVLGRDVAEYCADKMAATLGFGATEGIPTRALQSGLCALCGAPLLLAAGQEAVIESTCKLPCDHTFHEFCIRGWCIVGKKQTCPYCREKVDLARMFTAPWDRPSILYGQLLDWVRWLVAWQPLVMLAANGLNWLLGLE